MPTRLVNVPASVILFADTLIKYTQVFLSASDRPIGLFKRSTKLRTLLRKLDNSECSYSNDAAPGGGAHVEQEL